MVYLGSSNTRLHNTVCSFMIKDHWLWSSEGQRSEAPRNTWHGASVPPHFLKTSLNHFNFLRCFVKEYLNVSDNSNYNSCKKVISWKAFTKMFSFDSENRLKKLKGQSSDVTSRDMLRSLSQAKKECWDRFLHDAQTSELFQGGDMDERQDKGDKVDPAVSIKYFLSKSLIWDDFEVSFVSPVLLNTSRGGWFPRKSLSVQKSWNIS